jgi:polysaccharide biosynthesis/export protein
MGAFTSISTRMLLAVLFPFSIAGCTNFPNSGPRMDRLISGDPDPKMPINVVLLSPDNIANYEVTPQLTMPAAVREPLSAERYAIQPGDIIRITVFGYALGSAIGSIGDNGGLFKSVVDGGSLFDQMRVSYDGNVTIPYIDKVHVAGKTPAQIENDVAARLVAWKSSDKPSVQVAIEQTTLLVHVSGDVKTPGDFQLVDGPQTVLDAINKAGGPNQTSIQSDVIVRRGGQSYKMPMDRLMLQGEDIRVQPGDDIVVLNHPRGFIAMGAVTRAGSVPFVAHSTSLLDALGMVGGLVDTQADPTGVFVFRQDNIALDKNTDPTVFVLDFSRPTSLFLASRFSIRNEDTVYVTNAPLYQAGKIVTIFNSTGALVKNAGSYSNPP